MSVVNGQAVSAAVTNPAFLKPDTDDYSVSRLGMQRNNATSGKYVLDIQRYINNVAQTVGLDTSANYTGEADATGTTYGSTSSIVAVSGDTHKVAIGKLANAFAATSGNGGHTHTGSGADGAPIVISTGTSGTLAISRGGTGQTSFAAGVIKSNGTTLSSTTVSLTGDVNGILPIANGGTNAATKAAAFDSLSPMTTGGDLVYGGASGTGTRLANGAAGTVLTSAGTTLPPTWAAAASAPDAVADLTNFALAISYSAGAMTIAIKTKAGTDPTGGDSIKVSFLTSETSGLYVSRTITAATSVVVPSTALLGGANAVAQTIYFYLIDNAGTVELGVAGYRVNKDYDKVTTTAVTTAADAGNIIYSTTQRTNIMSRCVGFMTSTQTTTGTWAQAPTILFAGAVNNSFNAVDQQLSSNITSSTNYPTSNTYGDLTSLVFTPGIWDSALVGFYVMNASTTTQALFGIGTVSGNSGTGLIAGTSQADMAAVALNNSNSVPSYRLTITAVTTIYLKYLAVYSVGNPQARGRLSAVRIQ